MIQQRPTGAVPATEGTARAAETPMLAVEGLRKTYGRTRALSGLSLHVPRGSIYGFVGPNGAGKTTTLRMLLGLLTPTSGQASIAGYGSSIAPEEVKRRVDIYREAVERCATSSPPLTKSPPTSVKPSLTMCWN